MAGDRFVEGQAGFAEPGAGGDDGAIPARLRLTRLEDDHVRWTQDVCTFGVGDEVIDECDARDAKSFDEAFFIEGPGEVGEGDATVVDGTGDSKACGFW